MKKLLTLLAILATFALHAQIIEVPIRQAYCVTGKIITQTETDSAFYTWDTIGQIRPGWVHLKMISKVFPKMDVWAMDGNIFFSHSIEYAFSQQLDSLQKRIELLEQRGYTYLDLESPRPGLWTKEASGQYDIRLLPLNDSTVKSLLSKGWFYKN